MNPIRCVQGIRAGKIGRVVAVLFASASYAVLSASWAPAASPELPPAYSQTRQLRSDASLRSVAFRDADNGIAVGDRGAIMMTDDGGATWTARESQVECRLDAVVWLDANRLVAVGGAYDAVTKVSRGVALVSSDAGVRWRRADDSDLPRLRHIELHEDRTISADGDWSHSALARRFTSRDGGQTWGGVGDEPSIAPSANSVDVAKLLTWVRAIGAPVMVRDACRMGGESLCVVGDQGIILISRDNGKTWSASVGRDHRVAVLMVARDPESVAWSILGSESLEARNRVTLLLDSAADISDDATALDVTHQVAVNLGASAVDRLDRGNASKLDPVQTAMRWIAVTRPTVLVLDQTLAPEIHGAFFQAATAAGVQRVAEYSSLPSQNTSLHRDALLPKTGILASDMTNDAMQMIAPLRANVPSISMRYLYDASPSRRTNDSVTSGLSMQTAQRLTDRTSPASLRQLQVIQARMKQSKLIERLVSDASSTETSSTLRLLLDQTAKEDQFRLAWSMLAASQESGNGSIAMQRILLGEIAERFADRSAGSWARLRLQSIEHSAEWGQLESIVAATQKKSFTTPVQSVAVSPFQFSEDSSAVSHLVFDDSASIGQVRQASTFAPVVVPKPEAIGLGQSRAATPLAEVDLSWEFHPAVLVATEASRRRSDGARLQSISTQPANLRRLAESQYHPWSALLRRTGPHVLHARRAVAPPHLDGRIDDACWGGSEPPSNGSPSIRMAYDEDYVYVAAICPSDQIRRDEGADSASSIVRDHDLRQTDHLRLCLDVDQDLMTSMQLQATDARRTHDAIDGNPAWQPSWFLDVARNGETVIFEMAIDRRDLVDLPIEGGNSPESESWFISAKPVDAGTHADSHVLASPSDWLRVVFE